MLPAVPLQYLSLIADLLIFCFIGYYILKLRSKEKLLDKNDGRNHAEYHQIIQSAMEKEKKIIDDATTQAHHLITSAEFLNQTSKDTVNQAIQKMVNDLHNESLGMSKSVDESLRKLITGIQLETTNTSHAYITNYSTSLQNLTGSSLTQFQTVLKELETDLQKRIHTFHESMLPNLEKELDAYKQARMKQAEQSVTQIVQKVSQEVLNKSLSLEDHHDLLIQALEKAKIEGKLE